MAIGDYLSGAAATGSSMDPMCGGFELSRTQRFYGFGICFGLGFLISALSTLLLWTGNIGGFAVLYTAGNVVSLAGTGFLIGFKSQIKKMFDASRLTASIIFLLSMIATLVVAFTLKNVLVTIIFCFIQFLALLWYSLSYIPFARDLARNIFGGLLK
ncbi:Got1/Sft2-like family-domain-containing protein [Fimicolochytrium jonesii]|uniref:Got1/Sft2-like family-domain-containing protein n=1 Tax=Fimicolochytrium jonesii TaxID=1396493 RepID=UPI0022FE7015|nr:Got1/Sft2-like family-domain-containing protein [Fimicolochytrium jonesii]KAI8816081.1 Got1/Sft2-like family-domain-containing protein [Fimicolochytrium jonesii]